VADADLSPGPPRAAREFRAAWVATVANINWPSAPGLPPEAQRREAIELLDLLQELNFNAVILQVRAQADALYESRLEPWSYYLTAEQGRGPDPAYDPLEFWIEEAHARGLELHAWLNPYRAHHPQGGPVTKFSLVRTRPELVVPLSQGYWWMDPALKETQEHSLAVVTDLVRRYDLDGIHFDDYFYPYPEYNDGADFPDSVSWAAYVQGGGKLSRGDWRRQAVNTFIRDVYRAVKREKPHVKFGLSPFGIWRPGHPESIQGFDPYDQLYADARLWLHEGWIDYWTPQLYWPIGQIPQSYPILLGWWAQENTRHRHLWPGINVGRIPGARGAEEAGIRSWSPGACSRTVPGTCTGASDPWPVATPWPPPCSKGPTRRRRWFQPRPGSTHVPRLRPRSRWSSRSPGSRSGGRTRSPGSWSGGSTRTPGTSSAGSSTSAWTRSGATASSQGTSAR